MSTYGNLLNEILNTEYTAEKSFKDSPGGTIALYCHKGLGKKVVKITSENRNDHVFRELRGEKHENLPAVFEVCSCEDYVLVLEEFIEGELLSEYALKNDINERRAVEITTDVCEALSFLHSKGIIHRDVKPDNVIITPEGKAVLIDFSAARFMTDGKERDTRYLGTVGYAAPEQYGVFQSMPQTDIYALGVLLCELVLNTHPSVKIPGGKIGKIIKKCTDTNIFNRYQSTEALAKELKKTWHSSRLMRS